VSVYQLAFVGHILQTKTKLNMKQNDVKLPQITSPTN